MSSAEEVVQVVQRWQRGLEVAMFASGADTWKKADSIQLTTAD